jgi:hypothetical protein
MGDDHLIAIPSGVSKAGSVAGEGTDAPAVAVEGADDVAAEVAGRTADNDGPAMWRG